jgi:hypothetical protein
MVEQNEEKNEHGLKIADSDNEPKKPKYPLSPDDVAKLHYEISKVLPNLTDEETRVAVTSALSDLQKHQEAMTQLVGDMTEAMQFAKRKILALSSELRNNPVAVPKHAKTRNRARMEKRRNEKKKTRSTKKKA